MVDATNEKTDVVEETNCRLSSDDEPMAVPLTLLNAATCRRAIQAKIEQRRAMSSGGLVAVGV